MTPEIPFFAPDYFAGDRDTLARIIHDAGVSDTQRFILGDWTHIPHAPPVMSDVITVTVRQQEGTK